MLPCSDIDVRACVWAGNPDRGLAVGGSESSTLLVPSHDFPRISTNAQGLEKGCKIVYIVCTPLNLSFLGSPILVFVAGGEYWPLPPTGDVGQISNDFGRACGLGAGWKCEGRPTVWDPPKAAVLK